MRLPSCWWSSPAAHGAWLFLLLSIVILIVMGSVLEGAAALIIFGPLLMPVARQLGVDPLHYGVILVIGMGIGLFAPPLGLGAVWLLPDRWGEAGGDGGAGSEVSGPVAALPAADRFRARPGHDAAAGDGLLSRPRRICNARACLGMGIGTAP